MTGFIVSVFSFRNRVCSKEAFEGLELGEGKPSRPVLRGPGGRKAAWLLGSNRRSKEMRHNFLICGLSAWKAPITRNEPCRKSQQPRGTRAAKAPRAYLFFYRKRSPRN